MPGAPDGNGAWNYGSVCEKLKSFGGCAWEGGGGGILGEMSGVCGGKN